MKRHFRRRRSVAAIATLSVFTTLLTGVVQSTPATAAGPAKTEERPDAAAALITAHMTGARVHIRDMTTETADYWALPNGSIEATLSAGPVRVRRNDKWVPVNLALTMAADGSVTPGAHPFDLQLSGGVAGGHAVLAAAGEGDDRVSVMWDGPLPKPELIGNSATYVDAKPGIDIVITATASGFEEDVVLKDRAAVHGLKDLVIPIRSRNASTHRVTASSGIELLDQDDRVIAKSPPMAMWDAANIARDGGPASRGLAGAVVSRKAAADGGGVDLTLTPDQAWLNDPAREFPITLDPSINPVSTTFGTYTQTNDNADHSAATDLKIGVVGGAVTHSFLDWDTDDLIGKQITSATVNMWSLSSASCTPAAWEVWNTGAASAATRWNSEPSWLKKESTSTETKGFSAACDDGWVAIDGKDFFQDNATANATVSHMGLRASDETGSSIGYKQFSSRNATNQSQVPYAVVTYNSYPTTSAQTTTPPAPCVTGANRPYLSSKTPALTAKTTDSDYDRSTITFEWWATGGGAAIGSAAVSNVATGKTATVTVAAGAFTENNSYKWRSQANDGVGIGPWSSWCEFTIDSTAPTAAPTVSSTDYPSGTWSKSAGTPGVFTLAAGGVSDIAAYKYGLDTNPPTTQVVAATLGGTAAVTVTPGTNGPHTLYVQSIDRAGNVSTDTTYAFNVGAGASGAVTSPHLGDVTGQLVSLQAAASGTTGVTYKYRRADTDSWTNIPTGNVTKASDGTAISWPVAPSGGVYPALNWDVKATLGGATAPAGPVQVEAVFTGGGTSAGVKFTFDQNLATAPSEAIGPGNVNLLTGNFTVTQLDATDSASAMLARTFSTRQASVADAMFGPGWVSSVSLAEASATYTGLTVSGSLVQIGLPDGTTLGFSKKSGDASGAVYDPQVGAEGFRLIYTTSGDKYTLTDPAGNAIVFTHTTGAPATAYNPTSATAIGSTQTATFSWQKVAAGVQPTKVLEPVPAGITCTTMVAGCRALTFTYATSTTATGTAQAQWGDFNSRLKSVAMTAWNPSTSAMATVVVASYLYDVNGRLTAQWDPRLDNGGTHLWNTYSYDANGILSTLTPVAQLPWTFAYTTIPSDSGTGRLLSASRSALSAGTAVSTVVYKAPITGAGAPVDLALAQTSRWGQSQQPVTATAIFGPGNVPNGNQATGVMPSSWTGAHLTYLDASSRPINRVDANGGVTSAWFDAWGNVVQTLTAGNRAAALAASASDNAAQEAAIASRLSTLTQFTADGRASTDTVGPEHDVQLNSGVTVRGRDHTVTTYDQGAPVGGPYYLPTTVTSSVRWYDGLGASHDDDAHTTTSTYNWSTFQQLTQTADPAGLNLTTSWAYDAVTAELASVTQPAGNGTPNSPYTRKNIYYTAAANATYTNCGTHPEWEGLVCRTQFDGQPGSGPPLLVTLTTYDLYNQQLSVIEKTGTNVQHRVTTITYDGVGRPSTTAVSSPSGTGTALSTTRYLYDPATGTSIKTQSLDAGSNVVAEIIRGYDSLGRQNSYTDADGVTTTTTFDIASRVATQADTKATRTYTYNGGSERRGLPTQVVDSLSGTFTATFDADGSPVTETWPNNISVANRFNEVGAKTAVTYTQSGCGQADCTLYTQTSVVSGDGGMASRSSTLSQQNFQYDQAGRLKSVADTVAGQCVTRSYSYNTASDRTGLVRYAPNTNGSCQTATPTTTAAWTYDTGDRPTNTGYTYDALGRTLTLPAADTGAPAGGAETVSYYVNDMVRSLTQGSRTTTYNLDPAGSRVRSWSDTASGLTKVNHYASDNDSPSWTDEGATGTSRMATSVVGAAGLYTTGVGTTWQLSDLVGNFVASVAPTGTGLASTNEADEFGQPKWAADVGSRRYGWLGSQQRAADTPGGLVVMGVRLYNPTTGRFLTPDPIYGGNANAYDYVHQDPINSLDLSGQICWSWKCAVKGTVKWAVETLFLGLTGAIIALCASYSAGICAGWGYYITSATLGGADSVFSCWWNNGCHSWGQYGIAFAKGFGTALFLSWFGRWLDKMMGGRLQSFIYSLTIRATTWVGRLSKWL